MAFIHQPGCLGLGDMKAGWTAWYLHFHQLFHLFSELSSWMTGANYSLHSPSFVHGWLSEIRCWSCYRCYRSIERYISLVDKAEEVWQDWWLHDYMCHCVGTCRNMGWLCSYMPSSSALGLGHVSTLWRPLPALSRFADCQNHLYAELHGGFAMINKHQQDWGTELM